MRSLLFSLFFVIVTALSLALADMTKGESGEFKGDRRPGILHEPTEQPVNPGENGVYYYDH